MTPSYRSGSGRQIRPGKQIGGEGAAGAAVAVEGAPGEALKLLAQPTAADQRRLSAMLKVGVPVRLPAHPAVIAWPTDLVFGGDGSLAGFLMPRAPEPFPVNLSTLALRRERETTVGRNFGWNALLEICCTYSAAVAALHACGVVLCDINLKNVVVSGDRTVTLIDCDSCQVEVDGTLYPSNYFQHGFLAPELDGGRSLHGLKREISSDLWSLAVLIWMALMDGHHPFAGIWQGGGEPEQEDHAAAGRFPYARGSQLQPSPDAPPLGALPRNLQRLFLRTFTKGAQSPGARPSALGWSTALGVAGKSLRHCDGALGRQHSFPADEKRCPWCEYERYLGSPPSRAAGGPRAAAPVAAPVTAEPQTTTVKPVSTPRLRPTPTAEPVLAAREGRFGTVLRELRLVSVWAALSLAVSIGFGLALTFAKGAEFGTAVAATWHYVWRPTLVGLALAAASGLLFDFEQWRRSGRFWGEAINRGHFMLSGVAVGVAFLIGAASEGAVPPSAWSWLPIVAAIAFAATLVTHLLSARVSSQASSLVVLAVFAPILAAAWWGAPRDDVPPREDQLALDKRLRAAVPMNNCRPRSTGKLPPGLFANSLDGLLVCRQSGITGRFYAFSNGELLGLHGSQRERRVDSRGESQAEWCRNRRGAYTGSWFKNARPNRPLGRLLCYGKGRRAVLEWEDPRQDLYGQLRGRSRPVLFRWWSANQVPSNWR